MKKEENNYLNSKNIFVGLIAIFFIWSISGYLVDKYIKERGTFGDMFGAINALFSGFALFGIIISILMQQSELKLQRKELSETRKEFISNRYTNILFKQIDFLNNLIEKTEFIISIDFQQRRPGNIEEFISIYSRNSDYQREIININDESISTLIIKIYNYLLKFEELLNNQYFENEEKREMKTLLINNLSPSFRELITLRIKKLKIKKHFNNDNFIEEIEKSTTIIEVKKIKYILEYNL